MLKKRDGQIGLVNPFPPRGSPLKGIGNENKVCLIFVIFERAFKMIYNVFITFSYLALFLKYIEQTKRAICHLGLSFDLVN